MTNEGKSVAEGPERVSLSTVLVSERPSNMWESSAYSATHYYVLREMARSEILNLTADTVVFPRMGSISEKRVGTSDPRWCHPTYQP